MADVLDWLVKWMTDLPVELVYLVIGLFAAIENVVPPVPADVIALFGGFLTGTGDGDPWIAFLVVWLSNVGTALLTYAIGRKYGMEFFSGRLGRMILQPAQLQKLDAAFDKHGPKVIFSSRFLPGFRAVVPVFAGTAGVSFPRTAIPIAIASGLWYGALIYLGATAGRNWAQIRSAVEASGRWLAIAALIAFAGVFWWWWKTRRHPREHSR